MIKSRQAGVTMFGIFKGMKERHRRAKTAQADLKEGFSLFGIDFMQLHPTLHGALLREAMVVGAAETLENFAAITTEVEQTPGLDADGKAKLVIERYRNRWVVFDSQVRRV